MPCPEVVAISYIRPAKVPTRFRVEGEAHVKRQNTVVGFLTYNRLPYYAIRLNGPLPLSVLNGEEPINLDIFLPVSTSCATTLSHASSSSSSPVPIPPRPLPSPSEPLSKEGIVAVNEHFFTPEGSPAPSYFEPGVTPPSPTVAASEEALSEGSTEVEEEPVAQTIQLPENLEVGGWVHLQHNIVNHVIRRIHDNPEFFPALALQFKGETTIFGEDRQALEGLHIVCRRLERDTVEQAAAAEADKVLDIWDKHFEDTHRRADILQAYDHVLRRT